MRVLRTHFPNHLPTLRAVPSMAVRHSPTYLTGSGKQSVVHLLKQRIEMTPHLPAVSIPVNDSEGGFTGWQTYTWDGFGTKIALASSALRRIGVGTKEYVVTWGHTTFPSQLMDWSAISQGAIPTPLLPETHIDNVVDVLRETQAEICFVDKPNSAKTLFARLGELPRLRKIISPENLTHDRFMSVEAWLAQARNSRLDLLWEAAENLRRDDQLFVFHTSGTTAQGETAVLKPVPLRHRHLLDCVDAIMSRFADKFAPGEKMMSILPHAHIFGRDEWLAQMAFGTQVYFACGDRPRIQRYMESAQPSVFFGVPAALNLLRLGVHRELGKTVKDLRKKDGRLWNYLADVAEKGLVATESEAGRQASWVRHGLFYALMRSKIRKKLGGKLRTVISGGDAIPPEHVRFFNAIGVEVIEGYGLTETTGANFANDGTRPQLGTVGKPLSGVEMRLGENDEIQLRGSLVFEGYSLRAGVRDARFKFPFTSDGWFQTTDQGAMVEDRLRIVGRLDDEFKISTGEKVIPKRITNLFSTDPLIRHVVPYGKGKPDVVALIVVDRDQAAELLNDADLRKRNGWNDEKAVRDLVQAAIERANQKLNPYERIKRFAIVPKDFVVGMEITASFKLRRNRVAEIYKDLLAGLYR